MNIPNGLIDISVLYVEKMGVSFVSREADICCW